MVLDIIDVSNHQGMIDWDAVKASGVVGAFIKATEGTYYPDPWFVRNWNECKRVGLWRGAYHFARPSSGSDAVNEAHFFLDYVLQHGLEPGDALVLDNEDERFHGDVVPWAKFWFEIVQSIVGFNAIHYTGPWYMNRMPDPTPLKPYALWLASYFNYPDPENWPASFREVDFWQYTSSGHTPGVWGDCDRNWFRGTIEDLQKYGKPTTEIPTQPEMDWENFRSRLSNIVNRCDDIMTHVGKLQTEAYDLITLLDDFRNKSKS